MTDLMQNIKIVSRKYDSSTTKHKTKLKDLLQIGTNIFSYFQDLGEYFIIRKKSIHDFNVCKPVNNNGIHLL
jgi:hypothetical protein